MDKMTANMIAGAVLSSLLVIFGMNTFVTLIYPKGGGPQPQAPTEQASAAGGGSAPAAASTDAKPIEALLASANVQSGEAAAKKCATCHSFEAGGANKVGPNLHNIVGRAVASHEGFSYSPALKGHGGNWDYKLLDCYLTDPKACIPGTKMAFGGLKKDTERAEVIAYLRSITDNAPPLPAAGAQPAQGGAAPKAEAAQTPEAGSAGAAPKTGSPAPTQ